MAGISSMGIQKKVTLGCVALALVLFVSSVIAVFEFRTMDDFVKKVIDDDITGIQEARTLYAEADAYHRWVLQVLEGVAHPGSFVGRQDLMNDFSSLERHFPEKFQRRAVDSVTFAYAAYMQVASELPGMLQQEEALRRDWYFVRLQPVYGELRRYLEKLVDINQDALIASSQSLQGNFHRSIMPSIVAMILGLLMVALFHYYLNHYLVKPMLRVNKGIRAYRQYGKHYEVKVDGFDEVNEINEEIRNVIDLNRTYLRQLKQQ